MSLPPAQPAAPSSAPRARHRLVLAAAWVSLGALLLTTGCAAFRHPPARFVVDDSQLNWINISYKPATPRRPPCRLDIMGVGYIRFIAGASPRVASNFAIDTEHRQWQNVSEEKIGLTPQEARGIMQHFADAGLMDQPRRPSKTTTEETPGVAVFVYRLNRRDGRCITAHPALTGLIEALVDEIEGRPQ